MADRRSAYSIALLVGLVSFVVVFGFERALGLGPPYDWPGGDLKQHMAGAYAFLASPWRFPIFQAGTIGAPAGANIIFTDSAPFAGLLAKIVSTVTGRPWNYLGTWFFVSWIGQAAAGAFLMRQLGARGRLASAVGAIVALTFPTFLHRHAHLALSSHFLVILALGLCFRPGLVAAGPALAWIALLAVSLFTHAYLFVFVAAIFAAKLIDEPGARAPLARKLLLAATAGAVVVVLGLLGGYQDVQGGGAATGYDVFSMNLLSPVWPVRSAFFAGGYFDSTGGQGEGMNYLGVGGLIALGLAGFVQGPRLARLAARRPALLVVLAAMLLYALSSTVWVGEFKLIELPQPQTAPFTVFRASGRFFWPVGYLLVLGAFAALLLGAPGRRRRCLVAGLVALQFIESIPATRLVAAGSRREPEPRLESLVRSAAFVEVHPRWQCAETEEQRDAVSRIVLYAARAGVPVDTAHLARGGVDCGASRSGRADATRIYVPPARPPAETGCVETSAAAVCVPRGAPHGIADDIPACRAGTAFSKPGQVWSRNLREPEEWGRWIAGRFAELRCRAPTDEPLRISITGRPLQIEGYAQGVTLEVGSRQASFLTYPGKDTTFVIEGAPAGGVLDIAIYVHDPLRPSSLGAPDTRLLGFGLTAMRIDGLPAAPPGGSQASR